MYFYIRGCENAVCGHLFLMLMQQLYNVCKSVSALCLLSRLLLFTVSDFKIFNHFRAKAFLHETKNDVLLHFYR